MKSTIYTQNRELSWLRFNERVLDEAREEGVPAFERLKFISIFTSNLDEFFMIRVGSLYDQTLLPKPKNDSKTGMTPAEQLDAIFSAVAPLYRKKDRIYAEVTQRLRDNVKARNMRYDGLYEKKVAAEGEATVDCQQELIRQALVKKQEEPVKPVYDETENRPSLWQRLKSLFTG